MTEETYQEVVDKISEDEEGGGSAPTSRGDKVASSIPPGLDKCETIEEKQQILNQKQNQWKK